MYKEKAVLFLTAETPVHPGSGSEVGVVDLPIQRERYTGFPKIEASGLKGCIREAIGKIVEEEKDKDTFEAAFGPPPEKGADFAGALAFTDARVLFFPVKSLKGVFAWVTCPYALERFKNALSLIGEEKGEDTLKSLLNGLSVEEGKACIPEEADILVNEGKIILEEYCFDVEIKKTINDLAEFVGNIIFKDSQFFKDKLNRSLVVLSNDDFAYFVQNSTEIIARTRINSETGTVQKGGLWYEEYLPQDTVLYSIVFAADSFKNNEGKEKKGAGDILSFLKEKTKDIPVIQIGGNQTIGKGVVRINFLEGKNGRDEA